MCVYALVYLWVGSMLKFMYSNDMKSEELLICPGISDLVGVQDSLLLGEGGDLIWKSH